MTLELSETVIPELRLIRAIETVQQPVDDGVNANALKALQFLRHQATANQDVEAKTKLCTLYHPTMGGSMGGGVVKPDEGEAEMWSQSVFDKQLSSALQACSEYLSKEECLSTMELLHRGVEAGRTEVVFLVGLLMTRGIGFPRDLPRGLALLEDVAEGKSSSGQQQGEAAYELGRIYGEQYSYSLHDLAQSMHWYKRAAELGVARAYVDLTYGYLHHMQTEENHQQQAYHYAEQGAQLARDRYCQYILGHMDLDNSNAADKAVQWLTASAEQGFAPAIEELTAIYLHGRGNVPQNYVEALRWAERGSELSFCQTALGDLYRNGWGVERDYGSAFRYYQTAASQPDAPSHYAEYMLGEM